MAEFGPPISDSKPTAAPNVSAITSPDELPKRKSSPAIEAELTRIRQSLTEALGMVGLAVCTRNAYDGNVILLNAEKVTDVWVEAARDNKRLRAAMLRMFAMNTLVTAIATTVSVGIPILVNHAMVPETLMQAVTLQGIDLPDRSMTDGLDRLFHPTTDVAPDTADE